MGSGLRIACISDTHDIHYPQLPEVDAVIHAGDITLSGSPDETLRFLRWFSGLKIKHKIFIGGNHDKFLEGYAGAILSDYPDVTMIWDSSYDLEGYKVWGSPTSPTSAAYGHIRAFAVERDELFDSNYWRRIPLDADIVVTHGPALGRLDQSKPHLLGAHLGDPGLAQMLDRSPHKYHICGHIHGSRGTLQMPWGTTYINAAVLNEAYHPWAVEHIEVIELPRKQPETTECQLSVIRQDARTAL